MKPGSINFLRLVAFLQVVIAVLGVGVLVLMLWEPHLEGRNVNATLVEIYFQDPFLAYAYLGSIPFFVAIYQAIKILSYAKRNQTFTPAAVNALRTIKYCAAIIAVAIVAADVYLVIHARLYPEPGAIDGPEGAVVLGIIATLISIIIGITATVFQKILQNAVDIKSENDLTV